MPNHKFKFAFEMERGKTAVEYVVYCEVAPAEKETGPTFSCGGTPAYPASVESKEVYFVSEKKCMCRLGGKPTDPKCPNCKGKGTVKTAERREELDDCVSDDEVLEQYREQDGE